MRSTSVVIPVKDGERFLSDLLDAVLAQGPDEVLVIDSGSVDRSLEIARAAGVGVLEVDPAEFGHGRTRNLGAEHTSGEAVCFLTQDAVPAPGWLAAHREALDLDDRVGAAYGPHLPRPDTSPMISRELTEFFAAMAPDGRPRVQEEGEAFLSNVNACYRRECWEEIRFPDVAYAEDQAFARAMLASGWLKAFHPGAAVVHAHDYGPVGFARRYFDEYRGLRVTTGHVEPARPARSVRDVGASVKRDLRWMSEQGWPARRRALWTPRAAAHHAGRRVFSVLGSRAERLPAEVERRLSLEGTSTNGGAPRPAPAGTAGPAPETMGARIAAQRTEPRWRWMLEVSRDGVVALDDPVPGTSVRRRLHIAVAVPTFRRGSGGHNTIFQLVRRLEELGHTCSIWMHDAEHGDSRGRPAVTRRQIVEWFAPVRAPVFMGFDDWHGADLAVATGWETVYPLARMPGCRARAYLVNDHEPEFFATSADALFAERTYTLGLFPISASDWLRDLLAERYGCEGTSFRLGVDHDTYRPLPIERRRDTVLFYARASTPRRAVGLGELALEELKARRPDTNVVTFGETDAMKGTFEHRELGVATPGQLAHAYCEGTVGACLSLTNYSLIPQEMMACGMPCVDVAGGSSESTFGADGPVELAAADPIALAAAMESLLEDEERWRRRSQAGLAFVADASWDTAARQVEAGLREALRVREQ
jgi:glycosyltransferase involved in cell wall biosynthesis